MNASIPAGYVYDPYDPEKFRVRCPDCDHSSIRTNRPGPNSQRCPSCSRLMGVTPLSEQRTEPPTTEDGERVLADGGAVDHDYDENELPPEERIGLDDVQTEPMAGGIAFDLVTRQPLFVVRVVAPTVVDYFETEGFDLLSYKTHPYLPVRPDDTVYECVFITRDAERAHKPGDTYDFPRGRLMHVPVEQAWGESA